MRNLRDMDMRMTPGMEMANGLLDPSYPQKFEYSPISPVRHGQTNSAAKVTNGSRIMSAVLESK